MQLFSQGKDTGWGHTSYKIDYDITRSGSKLGIRWKITWNIDNGYYFGYNIVAQVWTEGSNYGRQIKANSPNKGSGISYFPSATDYIWFEKGYSNNNITGCRVIISSTNGGTIPYNTGADRTLVAPTGYIASTISSDVNFNIGENLNIVISDITNQPYNYKLYLDIYKEDNSWEQVKYLETTSKNFMLTLTDIATALYDLLPNSNSRPCRFKLETYISTNLIGTYIKDGISSVVNSNPEVPNFLIFPQNGGYSVDDAITTIVAGFGPYNNGSNVILATEDDTILAKNGATLEKIIIEWNAKIEEVAI